MNTELKHIRSMAEMILSELDKFEGTQPVTKPKAEPKFKVGDRVEWRSALNKKVLTIVRVGLDQFNMDAHAAGRVTFPNETGVYFQYDVTTVRGDIATFGEKALKMYVEPKVEERVWHSGPPPHVGWWNACFKQRSSGEWPPSEVWRWWNGKRWSLAATPRSSPEKAAENATAIMHYTDPDTIIWTDHWPDYARVPRIDPRVQK